MDYRPLLKSKYIIEASNFPYYEPGDQIFQYKLLLKQHYETGLSYLCITKQKNYEKYTGSGIRWKRLLLKIPSRLITTLLYTTDDKDELAVAAAFHSLLYEIPDNENFTNIVPELGYEFNQGNLPEWVKNATPEQLKIARAKQSISLKKTIKDMQAKGEKFGIEIANQKLFDETGLTSFMQIQEVAARCRESCKETLLERYGVDHNMRIPGLGERVNKSQRKTLLETYGFEHAMQIPEFAQKASKTRLNTFREKYGVDNPSQLPDHKEKSGRKISESLKARLIEKCSFCNFESKNISFHERLCPSNPNKTTMLTTTCEFCDVEVTNGNYKRWHGINCKQNPNKGK
jgi:hypothetical protein